MMPETDFDPSVRRFPVYIVLDTSGSMAGDPIEAVREGMRLLLDELKSDPQANEVAWLSVITFDSDARQVVPLTQLGSFKEPYLDAGGTTAFGGALTVLSACIEKEVRKRTDDYKADWKPLVFIMTDGEPTDEWESAADSVKSKRPANIVACAAGARANTDTLKRVTDDVLQLKDTRPDSMKAFFKLVTQSIKSGSVRPTDGDEAPKVEIDPDSPVIVLV